MTPPDDDVPSVDPTKKERGRPKKRRRAPLKEGDGRDPYNLPSAYLKAADHYCLLLMARLDLDADGLKQANEFYRSSEHWGGTKASLLIRNVPEPHRPPVVTNVTALKDWAHTHVCTRKLVGRCRWFKVCDALYPTPQAGFRGWGVIECWLKFISEARCKLVYNEKFGFGLVATVAIRKPSKDRGLILVPGT
jgi:hypothetical protein